MSRICKYFSLLIAVLALGNCGKVDTTAAALCAAPQADCGDGICRDFQTDRTRCGGCLPSDLTPGEGQSCSEGQVCAGEDGCVSSCAPPLIACDGACRDVRLDPNYCGDCTTQCESGGDSVAICREGDCVDIAECIPPLMACNGACRDVRVDPDYCGSCTEQCKATPNTVAACVAGDCIITPTCPDPLMICDGSCRDIRIDPGYCGSCTNQCQATPNTIPICTDSKCDNQCEQGYGDCNGDRNVAGGDGCETPGALPDCGSTRLVFVTAGTYAVASLEGVDSVDGANSICQRQATLEGLPGLYLAWMSDENNEPVSTFRSKGGPWQLLNGKVVANDFTDLIDGSLEIAINISEKGTLVNNARVATGTERSGARSSQDCVSWSETKTEFGDTFRFTYGRTNETDHRWTTYTTERCTERAHLYCFQQ